MNNTVKRSLSGVCFLAIVLAGLLFNKFLYAALFVFMLVGMMVEFFNMTMGKSYPVSQVVAIVTGVFLPFLPGFFLQGRLHPGALYRACHCAAYCPYGPFALRRGQE